ncbi:SEC-C metal-binding domain-containing protein [Vibrio sp. WJH972]
MNYSLLVTDSTVFKHSSQFLEGAILASNMAIKPMPIEQWLIELLEESSELVSTVEAQFHQQYALLMANNYQTSSLIGDDSGEQLSQFAQGFLRVWQHIEAQWLDVTLTDGSERMLQALLTTMMLAMDEESTKQSMIEAGIASPPQLSEMVENLDLMISDVANAANDFQVGDKSMKVNPYKTVGRNDPCPCNSGKKYKQCCLK